MAATNYTPIQLYYSATAAAVPVNTNLVAGELAINTADGLLFYKDSGGTVQKIGYKLTPTTAGGTGLTSFTANGVVYASSTSALATGNALVFDGTNLGVGVTPSAWPSGRPAIEIGGTTTGNLAFNGNNTNGYQIWNNSYYNGSVSVYKYNGYATNFGAGGNGSFFWNLAASGTAGNTITFTQAMTLDASGNLGLGITSPVGRLNVKSTYVSDTTTQQRFEDNTGVSLNFGGTGGGKKFIQAQDTAGSATYYDVLINPLGGNLLVGTTGISTGSFKGLQIGVNAGGFGNYLTQNPAGTSTRQWNFGMNSSDQYVVYGYNNTTFNTGAYIAWGGTSWTAQSDERKKDIIEPIADAMTKVSTLRAVIGKYKTDVEGTRRSFLIAQDVQAVLPEAVDASNPDDLGVQYTEVIPLLVAAIKEQSALITQLTARITALESA